MDNDDVAVDDHCKYLSFPYFKLQTRAVTEKYAFLLSKLCYPLQMYC